MRELTIKKLKNTKFKELYLSFMRGSDLNDEGIVKLLAVAVILLNHTSPEIQRLGYRIILFYGNLTGRYEALYDVAINSGLHPVSAVIEEAEEASEDDSDERSNSFLRGFVSSYIDTFRDQGIVLTEQQEALRYFVQEEYRNSSVVVAPTSYGKSELIMKSVQENPDSSILILVPSKALLAQTKKRLINAGIKNLGKVITHPEMYSEERHNRAFVLTQERLSRLLGEYPNLSFDMVFVDEAHNLLQGDRRNELLATVICILGARNSKTAFKFLTPFLCDELNLRVRYLDQAPKGFRINEYVKSERFYVRDFRTGKNDGTLRFYDHFLDEWVDINRRYRNCYDLIKGESLGKNIIYGNRPKSIEEFALALASTLHDVDCPLISQACDELEDHFDSKYRLISCLKKGVLYHHGSIPDTIRLYLESLFTKSKSMRFLVCNATLLEGVNLPIERLFLFDCKKGKNNLTPSQFKNLVGRVNRFSDVFGTEDGGALKKLESSIYILGVDKFTGKSANLIEFCKRSINVSKHDRDSVNNVLLEATKIVDGPIRTRFNDAVERLENMQPGLVEGRDCKHVKTYVGKLLIANSVSEIDVFKSERNIENRIALTVRDNGLIDTPDEMMKAIRHCFINYFDESREYSDITRLNDDIALSFYTMLLRWKLKKYTVKQTIRLTLKYWDELKEKGGSDYVFVGKWGDAKYKNSHLENWVRISTKDDVDRINLAIVRLKEEDDFFDNRLFRFIEVLNDLGAVDPVFYKRLKYGTTDELKIKLVREGFSRSLAELIVKKYPNYVRILNGDIEVSRRLPKKMEAESESDLLVFEARMNVQSAE